MKAKPFLINLYLPNYTNDVIFLHIGKIIKEGTHDELIQNGREYKKLYELQFAEKSQITSNELRVLS